MSKTRIDEREEEGEIDEKTERRPMKSREISASSSEEKTREKKHGRSRRKSREISCSSSEEESREKKHGKSRRKSRESSESESESDRDARRRRRRRRRGKRKEEDSESESESSDESESESDGERRSRRRRKEKKRKREKEEERERRRRRREKERKREKEEKRKKKKEKGSKGAVTNSWGKYGILRETDMWNKRPEFTAWLMEVKQVNLESLPNWEEKQMFKAFMEDHNTATFPSKKYYNLDAYFNSKMEKEMKRGFKKAVASERTVFNDEEQRRHELMIEREKRKEEEVETLKRSMQGGMAQAMKEQAQLREEMAYQYKIGNFEAAAAIQRRLDPDVAM